VPSEPIDRSLTHAVRRNDLVRVGSEFDGGYVVPATILAGCDGILGLGIHADWSFEEQALARMAARRADLYDPTTTLPWLWRRAPWGVVRIVGGLLSGKAKRVADGRARLSAPWRYSRFFEGAVRHVKAFIGPCDRGGDGGAGVVGIEGAMRELEARGATRIVLKMDIEGAEYETLAGIARWGEAVDLLLGHGALQRPHARALRAVRPCPSPRQQLSAAHGGRVSVDGRDHLRGATRAAAADRGR
jgi:hypothetical protein